MQLEPYLLYRVYFRLIILKTGDEVITGARRN
jgi:hypothetical protein